MKTKKQEKFLSRQDRRRALEKDSRPRVTVSLYRYVSLSDPEAMRERLCERLEALDCLGRIYLAREGINAQMSIPTEDYESFLKELEDIEEFQGMCMNQALDQETLSFVSLRIKVKEKIVADGIEDESFDPSQTGDYLSAEEFNEYVDKQEAVVIDVRNAYETEIGHFRGARLMGVDTFREQLARLVQDFAGEKDRPIALYCTGGIRCEKASAWMKHHGFSDVKHLQGGIINYKRQVDQRGLANRFQGSNFVFDERLKEEIGEEVISHCHLCRTQKSDQYYHCRYQACHVLYLGCEACTMKKRGYCSYRCLVLDMLPQRVKKKLARRLAQGPQETVFRKKRLSLRT